MMNSQLKSFSHRNAAVLACLLALWTGASAADLKQKTTDAFNKYVAVTEERMAGELKPGGPFLYPDRPGPNPSAEMRDAYNRLRQGEILVERQETKLGGKDLYVPDGMVHHWVGLAFIPGATLADTLAVVQDYDHRAELYKPEVVAAHVISHQGDDYRIFMRLYQRRFTTVVFNTEFAIHWGGVDEKKLYSNSVSTRVAEVQDAAKPDGPEVPVGHGTDTCGASIPTGVSRKRTVACTFSARRYRSPATSPLAWGG
jgi:hypothetical protein